MNPMLIESLQAAGIDTAGAIARFAGREEIFERFLYQFLKDDTYRQIKAARSAQDWDALLKATHTLKGVSGNLGMTLLFQACSDTVAELRAGDRAAAVQSCEEIDRTYQKICAVLRHAEGERE